MGSKFGAKREIRRLVDYLWEGEVVHHLAGGTYGGGLGLVALTGHRLLFLRDGWVNKATEDFPLEKISSVQWRSGLTQGVLTVFASGNKAEIKQLLNPDGKSIADAIRNRLAPVDNPSSAPTPPPPPAAPSEDPLETLRRLGELRDMGVVTEAEFEAKKAQILRRI
ncbi:hypothetical protein E1286_05195 [Nonomuraea terrae]|uniref:SHOCT domain-containing protein n=2 Tax=Nonomuraea terrae TaxID=2530383 RepID=A0A4R4Z8V6_9ACTN|nr:hypothetical protein E1286_05195 [Nonomuraea terrae]